MFGQIRKQYLKEINSTAYMYEHISGIELIYIQNTDENKAFSITFKTPPFDNTGVFHILEHCVLCGSKGYASSDPFNDLSKYYLYSYLNAITFPDKTMYPIASYNDKAFLNSVKVYLDAVFNPLIEENELIFLQEGWRYENGIYNGIVYNEMKAAYSDVYKEMEFFTMQELFRDTKYKYSAAGRSEHIVKLTYEKFLQTYKEYYKPSNAYLYLYGNLDIEEMQNIIHREYLKYYTCYEPMTKIRNDIQAPIEINKKYYSVTTKDTYVTIAYVVDTIENTKLMEVMSILNDILLSQQSGVINSGLQDLCEEVVGEFYRDILQPIFRITIKNPTVSTEFLKSRIHEILDNLVKSGIERKTIQACLNKKIFEYKEEDYGYRPRGLGYSFNIVDHWINGFDPFLNFNKISILEEMQKEEALFEKTIEKYIYNNNHYCCILVEPRKNIPKLLLENIKNETNVVKYKEIEKNIIFVETKSDLVYIKFMFKTDSVSEDKLPYIGVLVNLMGKLETTKLKHDELSSEIDYYIGRFAVDFHCYTRNDSAVFRPVVEIAVRILKPNLERGLHILEDILNYTKFANKTRIKHILKELSSSYKKSFVTDGDKHGVSRAKSYVSNASRYEQCVRGMDMYYFLESILSDFDRSWPKFQKNLSDIYELIFTQQNLLISTNEYTEQITNFENRLKKDYRRTGMNFNASTDMQLQHGNEAFITYSELLYNIKVVSFDRRIYSSQMSVLSGIINSNYLMDEVRIKGGAYGCHNVIDRDGICYFYSYRDPNLERTINVYDSVVKYIEQLTLTEDELRQYVIGAINKYDRFLHPYNGMEVATMRYMSAITPEIVKEDREKILSMKVEDLSNCANIFKGTEGRICVFGNKKSIVDARHMFNKMNYY